MSHQIVGCIASEMLTSTSARQTPAQALQAHIQPVSGCSFVAEILSWRKQPARYTPLRK